MCAMVFIEQQKIKIIKFWYESKSYVQVRRSFCREFNVHTRDGPKNNTIKRIVKHFEDEGSVRNTNKGNSGRPASVTKIQANIDKVRNSTINSQKKSHRRLSQELRMSSSSVFRILRKELYPYIISVRHKLTAEDQERRQKISVGSAKNSSAHQTGSTTFGFLMKHTFI